MPRKHKKIKHYSLIRKIEKTNTAIIYQVKNSSGATLALKIARFNTEECNDLILREFQILKQFTHPNIVKVMDMEINSDKRVFFLQPFLPGKPINKHFDSYTPDLIDALLQITNALAALHNKGFIHGDLKPQHLLYDPDRKNTVLIDFGYARAPEDATIQTGTFGYIAPEVLKGIGLDQRSDIYSLGVIIRETLTGTCDPGNQCTLSNVPKPVSASLQRMCSPEPAVRPSISEIYDTLAPYGTTTDEKPEYIVDIPLTTFIERQPIIDSILNKHGTAFTVYGEAGVGKTRLLLELKYRLIQSKYTVLYHLCGEKTSLLKSLRNYLNVQEHFLQQENNRYAVFRNVHRELKKQANSVPTILLIDEINALTDYDRALLRYIGFGAQNTTITVVCTTANRDTAQHTGFDILNLNPFSCEETEQLLAGTFHDLHIHNTKTGYSTKHFTRWFHKQSGGNPFYIVALLHTLSDHNILNYRDHKWHVDAARLEKIRVPKQIEQLILQQYETLSKTEQMILQVLALVETPVDPGILSMLSEKSSYHAVEHLKRCGFVKENEVKDAPVVFIPNQIIRRVIQSHTHTKAQRKQKQRLIKALEQTAHVKKYIPLLATLYHEIGNKTKALSYAKKAAQQAQKIYDQGSAIRFYRIVLANTKKYDRKYVLTARQIANLLITMGQCEDALAMYTDLCDNVSKHLQKQLLADIGRTYYHMGRYTEAIKNLQKAYTTAQGKNKKRALEIQLRLAYCLTVTRQFSRAKPLITKSLLEARKLDQATLISTALYNKAVFEQQQGDVEASIGTTHEHIRFTEKNNLMRDSAFSTLLMSKLYQNSHNLKQALTYANKTIDGLQKTGDINALLHALDIKACIVFHCGQPDQAKTLYQDILRQSKQMNNRQEIISCLSALEQIHALQGQFNRMIACADEGLLYDPHNTIFLAAKAYAYLHMGLLDQAQQNLAALTSPAQNIHYQLISALLAWERGNTQSIALGIRKISNLFATQRSPLAANVDLYNDTIYLCIASRNYDRAQPYIDDILREVPATNPFSIITRGYQKIVDFTLQKREHPDISPEIGLLYQVRALPGIIRLTRLSIAAQLKQRTAETPIHTLCSNLVTMRNVAESIQAKQEIKHLERLQQQMFPVLVEQSTIKSPPLEYLSIFSRLAELLDQHTGKDDFLQTLLDITIQATSAERGALFLCTDEGMEFIVGRDMDQSTLKDAAEFSKTTLTGLEKGNIIFTRNALDDPDFNVKKSVVLNKIRSLLCIPLSIEESTIGALYLDSRYQDTVFKEKDKDFLSIVARLVTAVIGNSLAFKKIVEENALLRKFTISDIGSGYLIGESRAMKTVYNLIERVAATHAPVLLAGETGTGKGMIARMIHQKSTRHDMKFTVINCGTIPETLLESELFGHKKGAFTGAIADKTGLLEHAQGGTVFLDEITNTSPAFQAKLLQAIEDKVIRRIGETTTHQINVRFIFATNKDLEIEVEERRFRKDLYYRINVFKVEIPPLRERTEDIQPLAEFFLEKSSQEIKKSLLGFTPQAMKILRRYHWAGNVRELRHVVERAVILAQSTHITPPDLQLGISSKTDTGSMKELKTEAIRETLAATNHNVSRAAHLLGISRRTIQRYIKKYNL